MCKPLRIHCKSTISKIINEVKIDLLANSFNFLLLKLEDYMLMNIRLRICFYSLHCTEILQMFLPCLCGSPLGSPVSSQLSKTLVVEINVRAADSFTLHNSSLLASVVWCCWRVRATQSLTHKVFTLHHLSVKVKVHVIPRIPK